MVTFSPLGTKKFFRKHPTQEAALKEQIAGMLERQQESHFSKVKAASHLLFQGQKVWELRVNPSKLPPVRVAFTLVGEDFTVVYLSHHIQKSDFSQELEKFLKGQ